MLNPNLANFDIKVDIKVEDKIENALLSLPAYVRQLVVMVFCVADYFCLYIIEWV